MAKALANGTAPEPIPSSRLKPSDELIPCMRDHPESLFYFLLNVGDGDTQVVLLPAEREHETLGPSRRLIVVDIATTGKLPAFVEQLDHHAIISERSDLFAVVIGTHPHDDHIGGMPEFLDRLGGHTSEYWEPGYYHPTSAYVETMRALESRPDIVHTQPTSGMTRFIGKVKLTTLSPGIGLRNRFDSYGTIGRSFASLSRGPSFSEQTRKPLLGPRRPSTSRSSTPAIGRSSPPSSRRRSEPTG